MTAPTPDEALFDVSSLEAAHPKLVRLVNGMTAPEAVAVMCGYAYGAHCAGEHEQCDRVLNVVLTQFPSILSQLRAFVESAVIETVPTKHRTRLEWVVSRLTSLSSRMS
jgi:hypothetical protein